MAQLKVDQEAAAAPRELLYQLPSWRYAPHHCNSKRSCCRCCLTTAAAAAADAECIVSVIVLMVSRLEKDSNLAETASKLATSIGKQVGRTAHRCLGMVGQQHVCLHTAGPWLTGQQLRGQIAAGLSYRVQQQCRIWPKCRAWLQEERW
jgi:hypothetical protein